jgi:hypothetical protein
VETISSSTSLNLARQSFLGPRSDETLHKTEVAIVGLGGGGSHIAQQLAHLGVGNFLLLDADRIEDTNLNRLVGGRASDVKRGLRKVFIAKRLIKAINPKSTVRAKPTNWQEQTSLLQECDIAFGCIDSLIARSEFEAFARRCMVPLIDIGMDVHQINDEFVISGQVALSMPGLPCMRCMGILNDQALKKEAEQYGKAGSRPQVIWPNGVLASTAVGYFVQLTTPWQRSQSPPLLMEYDGNTQTVTASSKVPYLPKICSHYAEMGNLGDPFWSPTSLRCSVPGFKPQFLTTSSGNRV